MYRKTSSEVCESWTDRSWHTWWRTTESCWPSKHVWSCLHLCVTFWLRREIPGCGWVKFFRPKPLISINFVLNQSSFGAKRPKSSCFLVESPIFPVTPHVFPGFHHIFPRPLVCHLGGVAQDAGAVGFPGDFAWEFSTFFKHRNGMILRVETTNQMNSWGLLYLYLYLYIYIYIYIYIYLYLYIYIYIYIYLSIYLYIYI